MIITVAYFQSVCLIIETKIQCIFDFAIFYSFVTRVKTIIFCVSGGADEVGAFMTVRSCGSPREVACDSVASVPFLS